MVKAPIVSRVGDHKRQDLHIRPANRHYVASGGPCVSPQQSTHIGRSAVRRRIGLTQCGTLTMPLPNPHERIEREHRDIVDVERRTSTGGSSTSSGGSSTSTGGPTVSSASSSGGSSGNVSSASGGSSGDVSSATGSGSSASSASSSGSTGSSGGPQAPVPALPMVLLFGAAPAALVARKRFAKPKGVAA